MIESHTVRQTFASIHRAATSLSLAATCAYALCYATDPFMAADRRQYIALTAIRVAITLSFLGLHFQLKARKPSKASPNFVLLAVAMAVSHMLAFLAILGEYPSRHYGLPMLIVGALAMVPITPMWTLGLGVATAIAWLLPNTILMQGPDATGDLIVHTAFMVSVVGLTTYTSYVRHRLLQEKRRNHEHVAAALEQLQAAMRRSAHDVRSPLALLSTIVSGLDDESADLGRHATKRLVAIADDLVRDAKASEPGTTSQIAPVLLSEAVYEIAREKAVEWKNASIRVIVPREAFFQSTRILAKSADLERVLSNLMNNAAEALPKGGTIQLRATRGPGWLHLTISDNGCGIAPENIPKVLRGGLSIGKPGGSGIGLSSAAAHMQQWGGRLELESEVGKGTTVTLVFRATVSELRSAAVGA